MPVAMKTELDEELDRRMFDDEPDEPADARRLTICLQNFLLANPLYFISGHVHE